MPLKRKIPSIALQRRVRPWKNEQWDDIAPESPTESPTEDTPDEDCPDEEHAGGSESDEVSEDGDDDDEDDDVSQDEEPGVDLPPPKVDLSSVSFGALARAQSSLTSTKRTPNANEAPRKLPSKHIYTSTTRPSPSQPAKRSSKNAPQEQSSKRPVTRMREIIPPSHARRKARDPRFDPLAGQLDEGKMRRAYAFLEEYRESEMAELRTRIRGAKEPRVKEDLKRQLLSMESRKKAQQKKDEADRVLAEHRQREKELVAQGKTPFYLKKSEHKKRVLVKRFEGMSERQVDKAMERRRKKMSGKEKKELGQLLRRR